MGPDEASVYGNKRNVACVYTCFHTPFLQMLWKACKWSNHPLFASQPVRIIQKPRMDDMRLGKPVGGRLGGGVGGGGGGC